MLLKEKEKKKEKSLFFLLRKGFDLDGEYTIQNMLYI